MYDHMKDFYDFRAAEQAERVSRFGELLLDSAEAVDMSDDCDFLVLDNSCFEGE